MADTKRPDDLVKLVNKGKQAFSYAYEGQSFTVEPEKSIVVKREIADHLWKSSGFLDPTDNIVKKILVIEELPVNQRSTTGIGDKLESALKRVSELEKENAELKEEIEELKGKADKPAHPGRPRKG